MEPPIETKNASIFQLGIIYKKQGRHDLALNFFKKMVDEATPWSSDSWFHIGHMFELMKDSPNAKAAYSKCLEESPYHTKALQHLGWLIHQDQEGDNESKKIGRSYLRLSLKEDASDPHTWYLLGRCYVDQKKYKKAYEAYQEAAHRDEENPTILCSLGILYFESNQYKDALAACNQAWRYSRNIPEIWHNLSAIHSAMGQTEEAYYAYQRGVELDPGQRGKRGGEIDPSIRTKPNGSDQAPMDQDPTRFN